MWRTLSLQIKNNSITISRSYMWNACRLSNKSLIRVSGQDSYTFLQGLITNDVRSLLLGFSPHPLSSVDILNLPIKPEVHRSLYAFILSTNGRIFSDLIVHNVGAVTSYQPVTEGRNNSFAGHPDHELLLEVDSRTANRLLSLLKLHKLRRQLHLSIDDTYDLWTLYPDLKWPLDFEPKFKNLVWFKNKFDSNLWINQDARLPQLGYRVLICRKNTTGFDQLRLLLQQQTDQVDCGRIEETQLPHHNWFRHRLGIGEGLTDHPTDRCFPLEDNGDLLNGVSFTKGCYLGQELTARTYHTGVIRKRLMPIQVISSNLDHIQEDCQPRDQQLIRFGLPLVSRNDPKLKLGRIRCMQSGVGLGSLFFDHLDKVNFECFNADLNLTVKAFRPDWWPEKVRSDFANN